jgi:hypothetical protein
MRSPTSHKNRNHPHQQQGSRKDFFKHLYQNSIINLLCFNQPAISQGP